MVKNKILIFVILCVLIMGSSYNGKGRANNNIKNNNLKVGTWKTAQTIQPFFYEQYLAGNDKIEVIPFTNPGDQKLALLAGNLDLCGSTLVTAIIAASKKQPIKIISNLTNKCSALVVAEESDIHKTEDLKGKIIAYVPGTMHHILLLETLKRAGLDENKDVFLKRVDFFDMGQALAQGEIDAFCSGEPYPSIAVIENYGRILTYPYYDQSMGYINGVMITTEDKIEKEQDNIQKLISAHVKTTEYLLEQPEKWFKKASEFGTDETVLELASENMELAWDITPEMIEQTKRLAQVMKELEVISVIPDIDALYDLKFLYQARNELKYEEK